MKVAIVILNWNGKKMLQSYLSSVIKYSSDGAAEVVVADNASTDDSMDYVRTTYPNVRTIMLDKNYGFADGYNRALRQILRIGLILLSRLWMLIQSVPHVNPKFCRCLIVICSSMREQPVVLLINMVIRFVVAVYLIRWR